MYEKIAASIGDPSYLVTSNTISRHGAMISDDVTDVASNVSIRAVEPILYKS